MRVRQALTASLGVAGIAAMASCSGGGGSSPSPVTPGVVATPTPAPGGKTANVTLVIEWPKPVTSASRRRNYVSNGTESITYAINGGTAVPVNNPNLSPGAGAFTQTTSVSVAAPVSPPDDTFTINAYDKTGGTGNLLGSGRVTQTIAIDTANTVPVTLNGNLAKIVVTARPGTFVSGTSPAYTIVGAAPEAFDIEPEDADGYVIVSPGNIPGLTLKSATPASISATQTSTANEYAIQSHVPGSTITFTASGTNLAGAAVTSTFTVTSVAALYVANHGVNGANPSVAIYPITATASSTPIAVLQGAKTVENLIQFPAVDANGTLYLSNQGPMAGGIYGPTSGYISIFNGSNVGGNSSAQNGNQAPDDIITGLQRPEGLAFDTAGDLFVMLERSLVEYGPSAGSASSPIATIGGPNPTLAAPAPVNNTDLSGCYGVSVDAAGLIYTACSDVAAVYAKGANGNVAPVQVIQPTLSTTVAGMTLYSSLSWLSIATDSTGEIYMPDANNNDNSLTAYAAGANDSSSSNAMTAFTSMATGYNIPWGVAVDATNQIYVSNYGGSTVNIFASKSTLQLGVAATTLTTGISSPFGIAVR